MKQATTNLRHAIKANYKTEPLTTNLSVAVADRIFGKQAAYSSLHEKWYYILIGILSVAALCWCVIYMSSISLPPAYLLFIIPIACFWWLAKKELSLFTRQLSEPV